MRALRFASHETSNQGIGRKLLLHVKHQFRESIACNQGATAHVALRSLVNKSWTDLHEDMLQRRYRPFPEKTWQMVSPDTAANLIGNSNTFNLAGYSETGQGQRGSGWAKG